MRTDVEAARESGEPERWRSVEDALVTWSAYELVVNGHAALPSESTAQPNFPALQVRTFPLLQRVRFAPKRLLDEAVVAKKVPVVVALPTMVDEAALMRRPPVLSTIKEVVALVASAGCVNGSPPPPLFASVPQ